MFSLKKDVRRKSLEKAMSSLIKMCRYSEEHPSTVKVTKKRKNNTGLAHLYPKEDKVVFGVHPYRWNSLSSDHKFQTLVHEVTHLQYTGHMPRFWNEMTENLKVALLNKERIARFITSEEQRRGVADAISIYNVFDIYEKALISNMRDQTKQSEDFIAETRDEQLKELTEWLNRNDDMRFRFHRSSPEYVADRTEKLEWE